MSNRSIDEAEEHYQRDQAEGERDDEQARKVTRGAHGKGHDDTRQESVAEREPAEGRDDAD
jgi:hypothetical protein